MIESMGAQQPLPKPHESSAELAVEKKAIIESAGRERFEIIKGYFARLTDEVDKRTPKPLKFASNYSAAVIFRMGKQAWEGKDASGREFSNLERTAYAMQVATSAIFKSLTYYYMSQGDLAHMGMMQGADIATWPLITALNKDELATMMKAIPEQYEALKKKIVGLAEIATKISERIKQPKAELNLKAA